MTAKRLRSIELIALGISCGVMVAIAVAMLFIPQRQNGPDSPPSPDQVVGGTVTYNLRVEIDYSGSVIANLAATVQPQTDGIYFQRFDLHEGDTVTLDCTDVATSLLALAPDHQDFTVSWIGAVNDASVPNPIPVHQLIPTAQYLASVPVEEAQALAPGLSIDESLSYPRKTYAVADVLAVDTDTDALTVRVVDRQQALEEAGIAAAVDVDASLWSDAAAGMECMLHFPAEFDAPATGSYVLLHWIEDAPANQTAPQRALAWYPLEDAAKIIPAQ